MMASVPSLKRSSRVEKILIFLVESGTVYCVIWVCDPYPLHGPLCKS